MHGNSQPHEQCCVEQRRFHVLGLILNRREGGWCLQKSGGTHAERSFGRGGAPTSFGGADVIGNESMIDTDVCCDVPGLQISTVLYHG